MYINKISKKVKIDGKYYITVEHLIQKLETCKNKESKTFLTELKKTLEPQEEENTTPSYEDLYYEEKHRQQLKALERKDGCKELEGTFIDIRNNYFSYKGKEVMIIQKDNEVWFKGNDVAKLLEYDFPSDAVANNIQESDKTTFEKLGHDYKSTPESTKVRDYTLQKNTIFINLEGLYDLIMSSRKEEAKIFRRWISHEVLPAINKFGSYSLDKENGSFYNYDDLYKYDNKNVIYIAYVGNYKNEPLFKYGISNEIYRREYQEHRKKFSTFDLLYVRVSDNNRMIESLFEKELRVKNLYREYKEEDMKSSELFTVNEHHSLDKLKMLVDELVDFYPTEETKKKDEEIKNMKHQIELMNIKHEHEVELLKKDINFFKEMYEHCKRMCEWLKR
ncbi:hypothetical protein EBU94_08135 [bacterium]|nr:hypothetical protein [bacterium]